MKNRFNFILLCFLFVSHESLADPLIRVEGASFKPLPLAVADISIPDNSGLNTAAAQLSSTIRNDLDLSGVFTILNQRVFWSIPTKRALRLKTFNLRTGVTSGQMHWSKRRCHGKRIF